MAEKYFLTLRIEGLPKRPNNQSGGWRGRAAETRIWKRKISEQMAIKRISLPIAPLQKVHMTLTRHSSQEPDYDGLVSSFKSTLDALQECKILANDKMSNFVGGKPDYFWKRAPIRGGFIEVTITEG